VIFLHDGLVPLAMKSVLILWKYMLCLNDTSSIHLLTKKRSVIPVSKQSSDPCSANWLIWRLNKDLRSVCSTFLGHHGADLVFVSSVKVFVKEQRCFHPITLFFSKPLAATARPAQLTCFCQSYSDISSASWLLTETFWNQLGMSEQFYYCLVRE